MPGKLFIVGTPIGNMEDITLRALRALREADLIAAEDTRRTAQLLARHGIPTRSHSLAHTHPPSAGSAPSPDRGQEAAPTSPLSALRSPRLVSYHQFNEAKRTAELLKELQQGRTVALVSDAGMPTISDPGQRLIQAVLEFNAASPHPFPLPRGGEGIGYGHASPLEGEAGHVTARRVAKTWTGEGASPISLEIIPGPSAVTMAMAISGLGGTVMASGRARPPGAPCRGDCGRPGGPSLPQLTTSPSTPARRSLGEGGFLFYGFLPHKSTQRRKALTLLAPLRFTLVFFESPYRLVKSLRDMHELLGNRRAVVARELTKKFEEILRGDLATILKKLENRSIKGEITVVVEGSNE